LKQLTLKARVITASGCVIAAVLIFGLLFYSPSLNDLDLPLRLALELLTPILLMSLTWYAVAHASRIALANNFGKEQSKDFDDLLQDVSVEDFDEFNKVLSQEESLVITKNICRKQIHRKTKNVRYIITDESFIEIVTNLNDRMISNLINNLVNKGLLETAFDERANDFVFWANNEKKEKPETD
jgi:hypothetical protein